MNYYQKIIHGLKITLVENNNYLVFVDINKNQKYDFSYYLSPFLENCFNAINNYFLGQADLNIPYKLFNMTSFEIKVLEETKKIAYGKTLSYSDLATIIGSPNAYRAVGNALHKNPLPLVIPCHRVIGKNKMLKGFGLGTATKEMLLRHENNNDFIKKDC